MNDLQYQIVVMVDAAGANQDFIFSANLISSIGWRSERLCEIEIEDIINREESDESQD
jgi:hypothetical protein